MVDKCRPACECEVCTALRRGSQAIDAAYGPGTAEALKSYLEAGPLLDILMSPATAFALASALKHPENHIVAVFRCILLDHLPAAAKKVIEES